MAYSASIVLTDFYSSFAKAPHNFAKRKSYDSIDPPPPSSHILKRYLCGDNLLGSFLFVISKKVAINQTLKKLSVEHTLIRCHIGLPRGAAYCLEPVTRVNLHFATGGQTETNTVFALYYSKRLYKVKLSF